MALFDYFQSAGDPRLHRQLLQEAQGGAANPAASALMRQGQVQQRQRVASSMAAAGPGGQAAALRNAHLAGAEADGALAAQAAVLRQQQQLAARQQLQQQRYMDQQKSHDMIGSLANGLGSALTLTGFGPSQDAAPGGLDLSGQNTFGTRRGQPLNTREMMLAQRGAAGMLTPHAQQTAQSIARTPGMADPAQQQQLNQLLPGSSPNGGASHYYQRQPGEQGFNVQQVAPSLLGAPSVRQVGPFSGFPGANDPLSAMTQPLAPFFQQGGGMSAMSFLPFLLSDEHAKEQARQEGAQQAVQAFLGSLQPQTFSYRADPTGQQQTGVMAQDVASTPVGAQMVQQTPQGLALDPTSALGPTLAALANLDERLRATEAHLTGQQAPVPQLRAGNERAVADFISEPARGAAPRARRGTQLAPPRGRPQGPTRRAAPPPAAPPPPASGQPPYLPFGWQPPITSAEVRSQLPGAPVYRGATAPQTYADFTYQDPFPAESPRSGRR